MPPTSPNLFYDSRNSVFFRRSADNVIFRVGSAQLPILRNIALSDIYLTKGHIFEPHWHLNSAELLYVVSGEVSISILDPIAPRLLSYLAKPGQVVFLPLNWWHFVIGISEKSQVVAIFNNPMRETLFGSDLLRKTPPEVFQLAYGVDAKHLSKVLAPITDTVIIGPLNMSKMINETFRSINRIGTRKLESPNLFFDVSKNVAFRKMSTI